MVAKRDNRSEPITEREVLIERIVDAPREMVWKAWTDPRQVVQWWGPTGFTTTIEQMDVRPGGLWQYVMHGPDGTNYPNRSVFIEIVPPERATSRRSDRSWRWRRRGWPGRGRVRDELDLRGAGAEDSDQHTYAVSERGGP